MYGEKVSRIAITAAAAWTGGGRSRLRELAATLPALAPRNHYLFVVAAGAAKTVGHDGRIRILKVPDALKAPPLRVLWEQVVLPSKLARARMDWILAPFNVLPLGPSYGPRPRRALIISSILPLVPEKWDSFHGYQKGRVRTLRFLTIRSVTVADHVFYLSQQARRLLSPYASEEKLSYLPMAPPLPSVLQRALSIELPEELTELPYYFVAADLLPYKGIEDAIQAVSLVQSTGRDVSLVICGNPVHRPYARRLVELAERIPNKVRFLGGLSHPQVLALMRHSVATITCSPFENPGRVPVEAMAIGSPVVSVDVETARETLGDAALYYGLGDHRRLANHLSALQDGPPIRDTLVERGRQRMAGNDWLSAARILLQTMEAI